MNAAALRIGDHVVLNSGGPIMIVESVFPDIAVCAWDFQKSAFPICCLTLYYKSKRHLRLVRSE